MKPSLCLSLVKQDRRVRRPFPHLFEGLCLNVQAKDPYAVRVCYLSILARRAPALVGTPPSWDHPVPWDFSSPLSGLSQPTTLDLFSNPQIGSAPKWVKASVSEFEGGHGPAPLSFVDAGVGGFNTDRRWVPPWDDAGNGFQAQTNLNLYVWLCLDGLGPEIVAEILIEARISDGRWVPPGTDVRRYKLWLVTYAESLLLWPITTMLVGLIPSLSLFSCLAVVKSSVFLQGFLSHCCALAKFFSFLQGFLSQVVFKICVYLDCWPAILLYNPCARFEHILQKWNLVWNRFGMRTLVVEPPPPPAPNIRLESSTFHLQWHRTYKPHFELLLPVLTWFEFSGLQPPWLELVHTTRSNCLFRSLLIMGFDLIRDQLKQSVDTAACKPCGVVHDGTIAQIFAFVVCYLRRKASVICFLSARYGSSSIKGHGWELDSINVKTLVLWEANLYVVFIGKLSTKRLSFEFVSWFVLHFMHLPCKLLNLK